MSRCERDVRTFVYTTGIIVINEDNMNVKEAYNQWAEQYDSNDNRTRDLEGIAMRDAIQKLSFTNCLEIGCGTGKNTASLLAKANAVTAVDMSPEMLAKAKAKIVSNKITFHQADITQSWSFAKTGYDLITFSLVLEHIENLQHIFREAVQVLSPGGHIYIGELHPFKQYTGSKARFETDAGTTVVTCFNHHISDFTQHAKAFGLSVVDVNEYFDNDDHHNMPRILVITLRKN